VVLADSGRKVVLVDADLGAANLHTITGVAYPRKTLDDFIRGRQPNLEATLVETPYPNLRLLSSAADILSIAQPNYRERQRLFRGLQNLDTDVIIFDIAAGTHTRAIDFFTLAPIGIMIVEAVPTSLENAFTFLKNLLIRHLLRTFYHDRVLKEYIQRSSDPRNPDSFLQFRNLIEHLEAIDPATTAKFKSQFDGSGSEVKLVVNSLRSQNQYQIAERFTRMVKRYLALDMKVLGGLPYESTMVKAITARKPIVTAQPECGYARGMKQICRNLKI
jgi:flagellar biosynthesis protein FlhG